MTAVTFSSCEKMFHINSREPVLASSTESNKVFVHFTDAVLLTTEC